MMLRHIYKDATHGASGMAGGTAFLGKWMRTSWYPKGSVPTSSVSTVLVVQRFRPLLLIKLYIFNVVNDRRPMMVSTILNTPGNENGSKDIGLQSRRFKNRSAISISEMMMLDARKR